MTRSLLGADERAFRSMFLPRETVTFALTTATVILLRMEEERSLNASTLWRKGRGELSHGRAKGGERLAGGLGGGGASRAIML